jgi:ketosteroid isomerase-like protein
MKHHWLIAVVSLAALATLTVGCRTGNVDTPGGEAAVRAALDRQVRDWNAGDLAGFMEVYARSERTRFASGGDLSVGWQTVFDRYRKKYGTGAAMGILNFSDLDITQLAPDVALAFGRWHLQREAEVSSGLFTLLFRKTSSGWRIVHDHTSAAAKP